ncbi:adenine-specific DNA-methyltransferase [Evansella vedderi]|uniref:Adenine-specific DNA-methyltransferase n=1 Tax=Evansella vedderi TaxID=38282 RepID=A0ABU0A2W9_9BACI|nr:DNA methyltransferase [Evansella vedderi]MDQ0257600.1 adenine-specific DNA-methyltransferase [Evansella vedderi]
MKDNKYKRLDKKALVNIIEKLEKQRGYGIVWEQEMKPEDSIEKYADYYPFLKCFTERNIIKEVDAPNHILIEGDNYHALTCLNITHENAVDLIYIDPPYNIGNKYFVYKDDYVDKTDTYRHSKWLSFMEKRLKLARRLLKDDGCIFISINEEEASQLKLLCDSIFGQKNYLTMFTIKVRHEERILTGDKDFQEVVEYLLMYRKTDRFKPVKIKKDNTSLDEYIYDIEILDDTPSEIVEWDGKEVKIFTNDQYKINKSTPSSSLLKRYNIRGALRKSNTSGRFYVKHIEPKYKDSPGYLFKVENMGADGLGYRYFLSPPEGRVNGDYFQGIPLKRSIHREIPHPNYLDFEKDFNNVGYEGGVEFKNGKKPINFLMKIFELGKLIEKKNAVVLDFFGGSGSTAHALMAFNEIHSGNRQAILCQKNEEDKIKVMDEVTFPRMKNIIKGYTVRRKEEFIVEKVKLTKRNIKKASEIMDELEEKQKELVDSGLYDDVKLEFENQELKLFGIRKKSSNFEGYYANLRYFKVDFIKKQLKKELAKNCLGLLSLKENVFDLYKETESYIILKTDERVLAIYHQILVTDFNDLKEELNKMTGEKRLYVVTSDPYNLNINAFNHLDLDVVPLCAVDIINIYDGSGSTLGL